MGEREPSLGATGTSQDRLWGGGGGHGQVVPVPGGPGEGAGVGAIVLGALELGLQREYDRFVSCLWY